MEITQQTQQAQQTGQTSEPTEPSSREQISSDFETFLKMLAAQMKNQDPLNPIESADYATQLATFSGVEQAVLTNDLLRSLGAHMTAGGLVEMAALVGKEVRSIAPVFFDGQSVELLPTRAVFADTVELVVSDLDGNEVQRVPVPQGAKSIEWAGEDPDGSPLPTGLYRFEVVGTVDDEVISYSIVEAFSTVQEVRIEAGKTLLLLAGGASIDSNDATALRDGRR